MSLRKLGITHFSIKELVHPYVYNKYGAARCIQFLDLRVVRAWDWIRETRGNSIYINTWGIDTPDWYPDFDDRGLRWPGESDTGSLSSQHYFGRALDGDEKGIKSKELYEWLLNKQEKLLEFGVTTIENINFTRTWIHLDCRNWGREVNELQIVTP